MNLPTFYRLISWLFLPPFTLALTIGLAVRRSFSWKESLFWLFLVGIIGYGAEIVYFFLLRIRHKIDIDVKNRGTRERLLKMSVISLTSVFIIVLFLTEALVLQKTVLAATIINLLFVIVLDIVKMELSFHIGMLTMLGLYTAVYISYVFVPFASLSLVLTGFARYKLKMHTLSELIIAFIVSAAVYGVVLWV